MHPELVPDCLPMLIGSFPLDDHRAASRLILDHTPDIPLWAQLPVYPEEGMVPQFLTGMPALVKKGGKTYIDTAADAFDADLLAFFEDYMTVSEKPELPPTRMKTINMSSENSDWRVKSSTVRATMTSCSTASP